MREDSKNVQIVREAFRLWNDSQGKSVDHWLSQMSDDVTIRSIATDSPEFAYPKAAHGKMDARQYFDDLNANWEMVHFTPGEFLSDSDRVIVISRIEFKNRKTLKTVQSDKIDIFRLRDGLITELYEFFDTARTIAATVEE